MKTKQGLSFFKVILFFSSLLFCLIVQAAESRRLWKNISPEGAAMQAVVFSQSHPDIVYALSKKKNTLYKSENGGVQWEKVKREGKHQFRSTGLIVDSTNPQILLTTTYSYTERVNDLGRSGPIFGHALLYRSTDGGQHWHLVDLPINEHFLRLNTPNAKSLRAVVRDDKSERHIAVSQDGGAHWVLSNNMISHSKDNQFVTIQAIAPNDSHLVYGSFFDANSGAGVLKKSIDSGSHWFSIQPSGFVGYGGGLIIHPADNNLLYSQFHATGATDAQWFRSQDGGLNWKVMGVFGEKFFQSNLILSPIDSSWLLATVFTSNGRKLFNSTDFGETWTLSQSTSLDEEPFIYEQNIVVNPQNNQHLLSTSFQGISSSQNGGQDWQSHYSGFTSEISGNLSIAQDDPAIMYFSPLVERKGVYFKSATGGAKWERFTISNEMISHKCQRFIINPADHNDIICSTFEEGNIYRSTDAGEAWALFRSEAFLPIRFVFASDGQSIYFTKTRKSSDGAFYEELYKKVGGEEKHLKWTQSEKGTVVSIVVHPSNSSIVYIVARDNGSTSVYKSSDEGEHWQKQVGAVFTSYQLLIHPNYPSQLVFVDGPTISFSNNGGNTWEPLSFSSLDEGETIVSAIFNPKNREGLFLFTHKGVYETKNLGKNLQLLTTDFNGFVGSFFQTVSDEVFISSSAGIFTLINQAYTEKEESCLFTWAEQQFPTLFSPALVDTQAFSDYNYRYYDKTHTYLGFFQHDKIHLLEAGKSNEIKDVGFMEYYQYLAGCD